MLHRVTRILPLVAMVVLVASIERSRADGERQDAAEQPEADGALAPVPETASPPPSSTEALPDPAPASPAVR